MKDKYFGIVNFKKFLKHIINCKCLNTKNSTKQLVDKDLQQ